MIEPREPPEHHFPGLRRDAGAVVVDGEDRIVLVELELHLHSPCGVLDGVVQQVAHHPFEEHRVAGDLHRSYLAGVDEDLGAQLLGPLSFHGRGHDVVEVDRHPDGADLACVAPGEQQQLVDERLHP